MIVAFVAFAARLLLVAAASGKPGCSLEAYVRSADGAQILAAARGWTGHLDAVRQETFFRQLVENGIFSSSHLIRFLPAAPGAAAGAMALGLSAGLGGTVPFWILGAVAAALAARWSRDARVGLAVAVLPPIQLYASTFLAYEPAFFLTTIGAYVCARRNRWLLAGSCVGFGAWVRPESLFAALGLAWWAVRGRVAKGLARLVLGASLVAAAGAALVAWRFGPLLAEMWTGGASATAAGGGGSFVGWPAASYLAAVVDGSRPAWKIAYVSLHLAAAVLSIVTLAARIGRNAAGGALQEQAILIWLGLHLLFVLSLAETQGFDDLPRYLGLVAPALAFGALRWFPKSRGVWVALAAASMCVAYIPAAKNILPECAAHREARWRGPFAWDGTAQGALSTDRPCSLVDRGAEEIESPTSLSTSPNVADSVGREIECESVFRLHMRRERKARATGTGGTSPS